MPDPNSRLVYSTDGGRVIDNSEPRPARARAGQPSVRTTPPADGFTRIQREKKGRGGKTVTVVTGLPGAWLSVRLTTRGADRGIDITGDKSPRRVAVQVKHVDTPVGRPVLQQLIGAAQADGFTDAVLTSSSGFTTTVRDLAREHKSSIHLQLWDRAEIVKRIDALDAALFKAMVSPLIPHLVGKRPA